LLVVPEHPFLADEAAPDSLIRRWTDGTLPSPEWTHAAHLAACAWLTFDYRGEDLAQAMKRELIRFNTAVGTPNNEDRGFQETLTRFWCARVEEAVRGHATRLEPARASKNTATTGMLRTATTPSTC